MQGRTAKHGLTICTAVCAWVVACDSPSAPPVPAALMATAGEAQSGIAGNALAVLPAVRVEDARGHPIAGVLVSFSVLEGNGSIEVEETATDREGTASPGSWVLGPRVGVNILAAAVEGLLPLHFTATAIPGAPAVLRTHAGGVQSTTVGERTTVSPAVQVLDANENPVPGVPVTFRITGGDGWLDDGRSEAGGNGASITVATDASGVASLGGWTVGTIAGMNALDAGVSGLADVVTFLAIADPGPAANLSPLVGLTRTATVASAATSSPSVRVTDDFGNAVRDVEVTFSVTVGDGSLSDSGTRSNGEQEATIATDVAGIATLGTWVLGTRAGANAVEAKAAGVEESVTFEALGTPGAPAAASVQAGDAQTATAGASVPVAPAVAVADEWGNPTPGVVVTFEITAGGGALSGATRSTDGNGIAELGAWNLGPVPGPNSVAARIEGLSPVNFSATGTPGTGGTGSGSGGGASSGFTLEMRYTTVVAGSQLQAFNAAADRWARAITGDLPDVWVSVAAGGCGAPHPAVSETIDDVVIFVTVKSIDGPGKVLGSAGPCRIRSGSGLPALGIIYLDADDLDNLANNGLLEDVIVHELGHVLGIGTLWPSGLVSGQGGADPVFTGGSAVSAFLAAGGTSYSGTPVPIENTGGAGTKDAHWRESVLATEIMTGWVNYGGNPLSAITIGSLQDMGYQVDLAVADGFQMSGLTSQGQGGPLPGMEMLEGVLPPPITVPGNAAAATSNRAAARGIVAQYGTSKRPGI